MNQEHKDKYFKIIISKFNYNFVDNFIEDIHYIWELTNLFDQYGFYNQKIKEIGGRHRSQYIFQLLMNQKYREFQKFLDFNKIEEFLLKESL